MKQEQYERLYISEITKLMKKYKNAYSAINCVHQKDVVMGKIQGLSEAILIIKEIGEL
jgi:hypothetical protein